MKLPFALYLVTIALTPFMWFPPPPWDSGKIQWSDLVFLLGATGWIKARWDAIARLQVTPALWSLAAYLAATGVSFAVANPTAQGRQALIGAFMLGALAFITADFSLDPRARASLAKTVCVSSLILAAGSAGGLALFYAGVSNPLVGVSGDIQASEYFARMQSFTTNPNMLASYCIFASAVVASDASGLSPRTRRFTQFALFGTILLTFSRSILGFILAVLIRRARSAKGWGVAAAFALLCVLGIASLSRWNLHLNPERPWDTRFEFNVPATRWLTGTSAFNSIIEHPLLGLGPGKLPGNRIGLLWKAHCTPVNIGATIGLPALFAFTTMIFCLWRTRKKPMDMALWGGLAGLALDSLACDIEHFRHFWILLGLVGGPALCRWGQPSSSAPPPLSRQL